MRGPPVADFRAALPYALKHEGGWVDDPDDPGGATNFGVTLKVAASVGITTKEQLRNITQDQVAQVYRQYWRFDGIHSQRVATKLLDMAVNMGLKTAVNLAQRGLNAAGASLSIDGLWGPQTLACINAMPEERALSMLCNESKTHYLDCVLDRPRSQKFLAGWLKRAKEIPE